MQTLGWPGNQSIRRMESQIVGWPVGQLVRQLVSQGGQLISQSCLNEPQDQLTGQLRRVFPHQIAGALGWNQA